MDLINKRRKIKKLTRNFDDNILKKEFSLSAKQLEKRYKLIKANSGIVL
jgi:hypothetical protein